MSQQREKMKWRLELVGLVGIALLICGCNKPDNLNKPDIADLKIGEQTFGKDLVLPKWKVSIEGDKFIVPGLEFDSEGQVSFTVGLKRGPLGIQTTIFTFKIKDYEFDWFPRDARFSANLEINNY